VTPFREDSVDYEAYAGLIEWQIDCGSHGIVVAGTTGEPASLTLEERERLVVTAVNAVQGRIPVIAGTGTTNFDETLRLSRHAEQAGVAAVLVVVPYYTRPTQEGLYHYFRRIAAAVHLPVILYNIPGRTAVNLEVGTALRLAADVPNVVGVKEANKDFDHITRLFHHSAGRLAIYSGVEAFCFPMLALGGAGHISATGNVMPREVARLYDLVQTGRWEEARRLHDVILPVSDALFIETNPVPAKAILSWMGRIRPDVRAPLAPLTPESQRRVRLAAEQAGLFETRVAGL
jgi:4-hydroxy-tetrahydrodipicolinate synthase